jgi:hypothetical protein
VLPAPCSRKPLEIQVNLCNNEPAILFSLFFVMEKKIKKGNHANYEIEIIVTSTEQDEAKQVMLKQFQKDFEMT